MLPPSRPSSTSAPSSRRQSDTVDQDGSRAGTAQPEAGTSGSGKIVQGRMYAMSRGTFAGESVRHSLELLQEPVSGRRRTDKDRRPLAHCPILRLRVYKCRQSQTGDWVDTEVDTSSFEASNYVCAAEMQPHTSALSSSNTHAANPTPRLARPKVTTLLNQEEPDGASSSHSNRGEPSSPTVRGPRAFSSPASSSVSRSRLATLPSIPVTEDRPLHRIHTKMSSTTSEQSRNQDQPQNKRRKAGEERNFFGALHLPALKLPDLNGEICLWFLFTELTVQLEGTYVLRFRVYDLSTIVGYSDQPVQPLVEIESSPFTVFSPRSYPGMPPLTALTEHFTSLGLKMNTKKNDKQARAGPSRSRQAAAQRAEPRPSLNNATPRSQGPASLLSSPISASRNISSPSPVGQHSAHQLSSERPDPRPIQAATPGSRPSVVSSSSGGMTSASESTREFVSSTSSKPASGASSLNPMPTVPGLSTIRPGQHGDLDYSTSLRGQRSADGVPQADGHGDVTMKDES